MNTEIKNLPRLRLADLLRRRKMRLERFLDESGIHSYGGLVAKCKKIGVQPPTETEYRSVRPIQVSSQQDGVVVLDPPPVIDEITGKEIDPEAPVLEPGIEAVFDRVVPVDDVPQKKRRKKRSDV